MLDRLLIVLVGITLLVIVFVSVNLVLITIMSVVRDLDVMIREISATSYPGYTPVHSPPEFRETLDVMSSGISVIFAIGGLIFTIGVLMWVRQR